MKNLSRAMFALLAMAMLLSTTTGCSYRAVTGLEDHPTKQAVMVKTKEFKNYGIYATSNAGFWLCQEKGDTLVCRPQCETRTLFSKADATVCPQTVFQAQ